jgi:hypothetical protein
MLLSVLCRSIDAQDAREETEKPDDVLPKSECEVLEDLVDVRRFRNP